jgi:hypothetical protein
MRTSVLRTALKYIVCSEDFSPRLLILTEALTANRAKI